MIMQPFVTLLLYISRLNRTLIDSEIQMIRNYSVLLVLVSLEQHFSMNAGFIYWNSIYPVSLNNRMQDSRYLLYLMLLPYRS